MSRMGRDVVDGRVARLNALNGRSDFIESLYQNNFGRASDPEGKQHWMDSPLEGAMLEQAFLGGAQQPDREAALDLIYNDKFHRGVGAEGVEHWAQDDNWRNAVKGGAHKFSQNILNGAQQPDKTAYSLGGSFEAPTGTTQHDGGFQGALSGIGDMINSSTGQPNQAATAGVGNMPQVGAPSIPSGTNYSGQAFTGPASTQNYTGQAHTGPELSLSDKIANIYLNADAMSGKPLGTSQSNSHYDPNNPNWLSDRLRTVYDDSLQTQAQNWQSKLNSVGDMYGRRENALQTQLDNLQSSWGNFQGGGYQPNPIQQPANPAQGMADMFASVDGGKTNSNWVNNQNQSSVVPAQYQNTQYKPTNGDWGKWGNNPFKIKSF